MSFKSGNSKQYAIDETKSNGNPMRAIAWAIIYLADTIKEK